MVDKNTSRDIEFLYEMGSLRFVQRTWKRFLNPDFQNLAEHTLRVAWIALIIAKREGATNLEKVMLMAMVHDIPESRTGDVDYLSRQYVERREDVGIQDMLGGTALEPELIELWHEYEKRECIEAKIVKDADNLDIDFELAERVAAGQNGIRDALEPVRKHVGATKLYTETARAMWHQVREADPHAWHKNGRNRFNQGDWSDWKQEKG